MNYLSKYSLLVFTSFLLMACSEKDAPQKSVKQQSNEKAVAVEEAINGQKEDAKQELTQVSTEQDSNQSSDKDPDLYTQIQALIANKYCQQDSDCQVLAIGARACGGPDAYQVYSTMSTKEQQVTDLAEKYHAERKQYNLDNQMMSICSVEPKPESSCRNNICVAVSNKVKAF